MKAILVLLLITAALIMLLEESYQAGKMKGYDDGLADSIEIFQNYIEEEREALNGQVSN